jgi:putative ABC transport system ATP-binding protein
MSATTVEQTATGTASGTASADGTSAGHAPVPGGPILRASGLSKRYRLGKDNFVDALRDAFVEIESGEMVAIVGPSGSGKSTLMHLLGCLDVPDSGEVWLHGRRVDTLRNGAITKVRREEVGFIFQGFNLVPTLTAEENVALASEYAGHKRREALRIARDALEAVGMADRLTHRPTELSGGQQQRVAVARALVNKPSVVLGDEPTGNLDTATSAEVMAMLREVNLTTGTTFVLVTHNPEVAQACDRVVSMRDGRVVDADVGLLAFPALIGHGATSAEGPVS